MICIYHTKIRISILIKSSYKGLRNCRKIIFLLKLENVSKFTLKPFFFLIPIKEDTVYQYYKRLGSTQLWCNGIQIAIFAAT